MVAFLGCSREFSRGIRTMKALATFIRRDFANRQRFET
jgi:hypothetical protein